MVRSITAADAVYMLSIVGLYDTPQLLQGYGADAAFATQPTDQAETVMGVDGIMSAGWIPAITPQVITLMPDSPSSDIFENWMATNRSLRQALRGNATIYLRATNRQYTLSNGVLLNGPVVPTAGKVLQARPFTINWGSVSPAAL